MRHPESAPPHDRNQGTGRRVALDSEWVALALRLAARPFRATLAAALLFAFGLTRHLVDAARHAPSPLDARGRVLLLREIAVAIVIALLLVRAVPRRVVIQGFVAFPTPSSHAPS